MILELNSAGIDKCIKELQKENDKIIQHHHDIVDSTIKTGAQMAQNLYNISQNIQVAPEDKSVQVEIVPRKTTQTLRGASIVATGQAVAFYEFGAGVEAGEGYPQEHIPEGIDASPGAYSQTLGKGIFNMADHPYWVFKHRIYPSIHPSMALYKTGKFIREEILAKVRRDFK